MNDDMTMDIEDANPTDIDIEDPEMEMAAADAAAPSDAPEAAAADIEPMADEEEAPVAIKPDFIPEKFWDQESGKVRLEALAKSYTELERRLSRSVSLPRDDNDVKAIERLRRAIGVPESAEAYEIELEDGLVEPDTELNQKLHSEGFTNRQVQFVYDLASDRLSPMIESAVATIREERDLERLETHFGGADAYADVSEQIMQWAQANVSDEIVDSLASSVEGVITLHRLMKSDEPSLLSRQMSGSVDEEARLKQMMQDPRYWRDRDPAFISEVTSGFRKVYGG